jgi:uncharacterized protein (DUF427 family)
MAANPAPGFKNRPDHRIAVSPAATRVKALFQGKVVADTQDALAMKEGDYPVVFYFPRKDVRMEALERSTHSTHCPFKGDASYFSLKNGPRDAVWSYETPFDEMLAIKEYLAFYPDKLEIRAG